MGQVSAPIAVAAATATTFDLPTRRSKVLVTVVFYTTAAALSADAVAIGSGTRDIAISKPVATGTVAGDPTMPIVGATVAANPAWNLKALDLGTETSRIVVTCAAATTPGSATHYRIFVD